MIRDKEKLNPEKGGAGKALEHIPGTFTQASRENSMTYRKIRENEDGS